MATVAPSMESQPPPPHLADRQNEVRWRWIRWLLNVTGSCLEWLAGLVGLVIGLSILATIPLLQFVSLGYLLEAGSRVARSGRWRDGFPGVRLAARLATIGIAGWMLLLPVRAVADLQYSAQLLGNSQHAGQLWLMLAGLLIAVLVHFLSACWRGGRPAQLPVARAALALCRLRQGGLWQSSRDSLFDLVQRLQLARLFSLGLSGFFVAAAWLVVPISIVMTGTRLNAEAAALISLLGILLLAAVLLYLPFLQLNFAARKELRAGFDVGLVRDQFRKAPLAFWIALSATLALAIPLYALKAELLPREAAWLPSIVFVVSILPARILAGWALSRADRRDTNRHFVFRLSSRMLAIPVVLIYGGIVYLTQFLSWHGAWSLYEQHAFMLPVPFLGL